mmetsp:Transcript_107463/g.342550  ORF Transcript_107463/g.342550 Transcript_107463/m.342550 type:complete len:263 (-) Transcript_107463:965-1753(-)
MPRPSAPHDLDRAVDQGLCRILLGLLLVVRGCVRVHDGKGHKGEGVGRQNLNCSPVAALGVLLGFGRRPRRLRRDDLNTLVDRRKRVHRRLLGRLRCFSGHLDLAKLVSHLLAAHRLAWTGYSYIGLAVVGIALRVATLPIVGHCLYGAASQDHAEEYDRYRLRRVGELGRNGASHTIGRLVVEMVGGRNSTAVAHMVSLPRVELGLLSAYTRHFHGNILQTPVQDRDLWCQRHRHQGRHGWHSWRVLHRTVADLRQEGLLW